jgi:pyrroloquinoline quinone biosynthesis protein D
MFRPAPFARRSDMLSVPRERIVITEGARPVLPRSVRLHFDPVRERLVVLSPEKVLWPDEISIEILKLCDGVRNIEGITNVLAAQYNAPRDVILADVMEFVQEWSDNLLLKS